MERLEMSKKERQRLEVLSRVKWGDMSLRTAAELLGLSYRHAKRVFRRYREKGDRGLVHGLRGRASNHGQEAGKREAALTAYREKYGDFGPTLAAEYLAKDGVVLAAETLRRWPVAAGLWTVSRKRSAHRSWRARKDHCGEMVQMDGSEHDWFEGRGPRAVLMVMIDDATNRTYARFFEAETTAAAFEVFQRYVNLYSLPRSLYVDKDSIYRPGRDRTVDEELAGNPAQTQFGRAMKELGVELMCAHSPQAKGRVERRNGVLQDRLVKAMRLEGIRTLATANSYLEDSFLPELNERFTVVAKAGCDWHRRVPRGLNLEEVLVFQEERVVQNDNTVRWRNRWFQLISATGRSSLTGKRLLVRERLDGAIRLVYRGRELAWRELPERPERGHAKPTARRQDSQQAKARASWKPEPNHPWRQLWRR
jgi:transposase